MYEQRAERISRGPLVIPFDINAANDWHWGEVSKALDLTQPIQANIPKDIDYTFIVFTNRSGSTYLCELLATTDFFPLPLELMQSSVLIETACEIAVSRLDETFSHLVRTKRINRQFIVKVSIGQVCLLVASGLLDEIRDHVKFIYIERLEKAAQVVSWAIANQTLRFTSYDCILDNVTLSFDEETLVRDLRGLLRIEAATREFFALNGIVPFPIYYEALIADPQGVGGSLLHWLGRGTLECNKDRVGLQKQAGDINREWSERLLASPLLRGST